MKLCFANTADGDCACAVSITSWRDNSKWYCSLFLICWAYIPIVFTTKKIYTIKIFTPLLITNSDSKDISYYIRITFIIEYICVHILTVPFPFGKKDFINELVDIFLNSKNGLPEFAKFVTIRIES